MHEKLERLKSALALELPNLSRAAQASEETLKEVRRSAEGYLVDKGVLRRGETHENLPLGLVAFGSLARQELCTAPDTSDFDHAIVAYRAIELPEDIQNYRVAALVAQKRSNLGDPGRTRLFGGVISSSDLINRIGLEEDTNRSHTQRMLFLEESVPIIDIVSHSITVASILNRYLHDYQNEEEKSTLHKKGVPRFLLNDVVRYWRTIAVDYQAKRWDEVSLPEEFSDDGTEFDSPKWGLRYVKLRSSRKLAFAGTIISLFIPCILDVPVETELLCEQFKMPPLARLAQLEQFVCEEDKVHLRRSFEIADEFAGLLNDSEFRSEVCKVQHPRNPGSNDAFRRARALTQELEICLERLFCSKNPFLGASTKLDGDEDLLTLSGLTRRYLLF